MHVLIFGGAGFVGLNVAQGLLERLCRMLRSAPLLITVIGCT